MRRIWIILPLVAFTSIYGCKNQQFAQWRGPDRNGIFQETNLLDQWPEVGPELLWVFEGLGEGYAAPAVTGEMIFVNGEQQEKNYLFAVDLEGNLLWKLHNGDEFIGEGMALSYPGARSTPTVMGKYVYATSAEGRIACVDAYTGNEEWAVHILDDLGGELGYFGYSESVGVDEKHVYCFPAGQETNLAALDRFTGETVWTSPVLRDTFAYGSPVLLELPDRKILMTTSRHHLFTVDRSNGKMLGSYKLEGYEYDGEHCNTPVYADGYIYFVGNDEPGQGAVKLELSPDGKSISEVWRNPEIKNNFGGLVSVNGHLVTTARNNRLVALDPEDGSVSDSIRIYTGGIIYADRKFICYGHNGTVHLVMYEGGKFEITGELKIREGTGHHFAHPVLANGIMYIRHGNALMAYRIN